MSRETGRDKTRDILALFIFLLQVKAVRTWLRTVKSVPPSGADVSKGSVIKRNYTFFSSPSGEV
uniref:Uncharacterized protein n=1 Tax=Anguilla anguilla TaxID=7936 RepID=A0A0E9SF46_ANGAN